MKTNRNFGNHAAHEPRLLRPCKSNATRGRRREKAARFRYGNRNVTSAGDRRDNASVEGGREKRMLPLMFVHIWMYA